MAVSGTTAFSLTVNDCIIEALDRIGGSPVLGYDVKSARRSLNLMFTDWANRGLNQWTLDKQTVTMITGDVTYSLGSSTIGLVDVYITRDSTDYGMNEISLTDYNVYPNKVEQGRPSQYYLQKDLDPILYIYPAPENNTDVITYWRLKKIDDITASTVSGTEQTFEVPSRFYEAMTSGLAYYMSLKRAGVDPNRSMFLKQMYDESFIRARDSDLNSSVNIVPNYGVNFY
tara:strand:+ start:340 stop:1026 length:687 start_codon:yes stop_codon:yes gene_type:complete